MIDFLIFILFYLQLLISYDKLRQNKNLRKFFIGSVVVFAFIWAFISHIQKGLKSPSNEDKISKIIQPHLPKKEKPFMIPQEIELIISFEKGHFKQVFTLIKKGVDINYRDKNEETLLHKAVRKGNYKIVKFLLNQQNIEIDSRDKYGNTPLHIAFYKKDETTINLLLENGAEIVSQNQDQNTILHIAVFKMWDDMVLRIIFSNTEKMKRIVNWQNKDGNTALHLAYYIKNPKIRNDLIKDLLSIGANPYIPNNRGLMPNQILTQASPSSNLLRHF